MRLPRPGAGAATQTAQSRAPPSARAPFWRWQVNAAVSTQEEQAVPTGNLDMQRMMRPASPHHQQQECGSSPQTTLPPANVEQAPWSTSSARSEQRSSGAQPSGAPAAVKGEEQEVPRTLSHALAVFFTHPSAILITTALGGLLAWRCQLPLHPLADGAVAACVAAGWTVQEWMIHKLLLHSEHDWVGKRIHVAHHRRPYYHVSIDDPPIVLAFMGASLALFWTAFGGSELAVTAAAAYYAMGLVYEFTHYIVHTRYLPTSRLAKRIRMHHLLHHTKNEAYWLAFTVPQVDQLFGTGPQPSGVKMSEMAKAGLKSGRGFVSSQASRLFSANQQ